MSKARELGSYEHLPRAISPRGSYLGDGSFRKGTRVDGIQVPNKLRPLNLWHPPEPPKEEES